MHREIPSLSLVTVTGRCMEPGLPAGCVVRVAALDGAPSVGDVVLISLAAGNVVHRVVWTWLRGGRTWVFHRGDAGGRAALVPPETVVGRVVAVHQPPGLSVADISSLGADGRRGFARAQRACRACVFLAVLLDHNRAGRGAFRLAVRLLLRSLAARPPG